MKRIAGFALALALLAPLAATDADAKKSKAKKMASPMFLGGPLKNQNPFGEAKNINGLRDGNQKFFARLESRG